MSEQIECTRCRRHLPASDFYIRRETGATKQPCRNCVAERGREYRIKNRGRIASKNRDWAKKNRSKLNKQHREYRITPKGAWTQFKSHKRVSKHGLSISENEFVEWYSRQKQACYYCSFDAEQANSLLRMLTGSARNYRLQVDRKDSRKSYESGNLVLACKVCNEHKKDFFTSSEFRKIAKKYLGSVLMNKLQNNDSSAKAGSLSLSGAADQNCANNRASLHIH